MPPCPISSPPPALALAMPWEAPGQYAFLVAMVVVYGGALGYDYAKVAKPLNLRTRIGFVVAVAGMVTLLVGAAFFWFVVVPYMDHLTAWEIAQRQRFDGQPCSLEAFGARVQSLRVAASSWMKVVGILSFICAATVISFGAILIRPAMHRSPAEMSGT